VTAGPRAAIFMRLLLLLLAGALHALAFAPGPLAAALLPVLQVVALAVLAGAVRHAATVGVALRQGFAFGLGHFVAGLYWIYISLHVHGQMAAWLAGAAVLLFAAVLSIYPALAAALVRRLSGQRSRAGVFMLAWAGSWAGFEWLRGTLFTGFTWLNAGYAHVDGVLAGWAPVLGVYGVAFAAALVAAGLAVLVADSARGRIGAAATVMAVLLGGLGLQQFTWGVRAHGQPLALRLVQGNVDQSNKFDPALIMAALEKHLALASRVSTQAGFRPDLVVLPETAIPLFQDQLPEYLWQPWVDVAAAWDTTLVTGVALHTAGPDGQSVFTNSVIGLTGDTASVDLVNGRTPFRYDKAHLVPFGEFVPFGFRWFVDAMVMPMGDFNRGAQRQPPLSVADQRIAFNICYEDTFGEDLLPALRPGPGGEPGATILANVSNLGWFGDSSALPQHLQMARMRSIETGRPSIRATNTGSTAVIDARGEVQASLPTHSVGVLDTEVQGTTGLTPYVRWGNLPAIALIALALLACAVIGAQRRKSL